MTSWAGMQHHATEALKYWTPLLHIHICTFVDCFPLPLSSNAQYRYSIIQQYYVTTIRNAIITWGLESEEDGKCISLLVCLN